MIDRKTLGKYGEDLALEYLKNKGWRTVGRNLKLFCGEIDLLMQDKAKTLVIVEVKTKTTSNFSSPQEQVHFKKRKKLRQLGRALWQKFPEKSIRIDVIAVDEERNLIDHIVNAVEEH